MTLDRQSRITKLEGGEPGISTDLMIKALLQPETSKKQIGNFWGLSWKRRDSMAILLYKN